MSLLPETWVPFDTILCSNNACPRGPYWIRYLYLGVGKYITTAGHESNNGEPCHLLLSWSGSLCAWSSVDSPHLMLNYHVYDRETCG